MTTLAPTSDHTRSRAAAEAAVIALLLGLLADLLFSGAALGLNAPLWIGALVAALLYTGRHRQTGAANAELACLAISFAAAAALAWRASPTLQALLILASGAFLVLAVALRSGLPWRRTGVAVLAGALIVASVSIAAGMYRVQSSLELQNRILRRTKDGAGTVLRILLIAVPVLVVFGLLFASADAVFEERLRWLGRLDLSGVVPHVFLLVAGTWFAGGVIWATFEGRLFEAPEPHLPESRRLKSSELAAILGSLALLFGAFVAVQLRYLFGGHDVVQETTELTYAEYARRGFFELAAAAVLLLPLLLIADWARRRGRQADLVYRVLAAILVVLLFVVMASALQRMSAYEEAYGLTEPRLYVVAVLVGLAAVFALFLCTVVVARNDWFVAGSIAAVAVVLGALSVIGPDAVIAHRNIDRGSAVHPFDAHYAARLGPDAVPVLVSRLDELSPADASIVACALLDRWDDGSSDGLRAWNWSRSAAASAVERRSAELERACDSGA